MMNEEIASELISDIGNLAMEQVGISQGELLLYAEVEPGMIAPSLFWNRGNQIIYLMPETHLYKKIVDLWHAAPEDEKWRGLSYSISGTEFRVEFDYGEGWSDEEMPLKRRERVLKARFPGRPVVYPSLPGDAEDRTT